MKPNIHLVGASAASIVSETASNHMPETKYDSTGTTVSRGGEAGVLLEEFLATIVRAVHASAGMVRMLSPNGRQLRLICGSGLAGGVCQSENLVDAGCGVCGKSAQSGVVESSDADYCLSKYGTDFFAESCKFVVAVPLGKADKDGGESGVVTLFFASEQAVTEDIVRALKTYAELMHSALRQIWQNEENHQANLLAERQSIANEIHDSLAQTLYYAKIRASLLLEAMKTDNELLAYKCAQDIDDALENSQKTVRELVTHFRCQMDPRGLKFALQKLVKDFIARTGILLEYTSQVENFNLPLEYELQVFLIVREAMVNIATHSGASAARLSVVCNDGQYRITIEDNGAGIGENIPSEGHYGMVIMHERALRIGGTIEVESPQGLGTHVQLTFSAPAANPNVA